MKYKCIDPGKHAAISEAADYHAQYHWLSTVAHEDFMRAYYQERQAFWFQRRARLLWIYEAFTDEV